MKATGMMPGGGLLLCNSMDGGEMDSLFQRSMKAAAKFIVRNASGTS